MALRPTALSTTGRLIIVILSWKAWTNVDDNVKNAVLTMKVLSIYLDSTG